MPHALHFLVLAVAGWVTRHQEDRIDSLREENRVLREHLGPRPLRLTDAQRRRLAVRGQTLGRLPATFADAHGLPSGDRIRGQPHGDIASLDQRSVVCRPIPDVVFCLVLWVHSRLPVEIMHLLSPRWPGGRS